MNRMEDAGCGSTLCMLNWIESERSPFTHTLQLLSRQCGPSHLYVVVQFFTVSARCLSSIVLPFSLQHFSYVTHLKVLVEKDNTKILLLPLTVCYVALVVNFRCFHFHPITTITRASYSADGNIVAPTILPEYGTKRPNRRNAEPSSIS